LRLARKAGGEEGSYVVELKSASKGRNQRYQHIYRLGLSRGGGRD